MHEERLLRYVLKIVKAKIVLGYVGLFNSARGSPKAPPSSPASLSYITTSDTEVAPRSLCLVRAEIPGYYLQ